MSHCIQIIVAPAEFADSIRLRWSRLASLRRESGFGLFPVDYELIDEKIAPIMTPRATSNQFMLLTPAFEQYLGELSIGGRLAYLETEYWGGTGGQGAVACKNGNLLMKPQWGASGTINRALELIGVPRPQVGDRFSAIGLEVIRSNDDLLDLIRL
ncbi:MAG: hypothetical protein IGS38_13350 [Synechococcales cyanobacterium M58_A2018_015]|nr:hypothetical protein [Synechococcales cyanobacterium M58_A2018_015]